MISGVLSVIFGILCLISPQAKMESIALFAGIAMLIYGGIHLLTGLNTKKNKQLRLTRIVLGIVIIVLAVLVLANLALIGKYLPVLVGFVLIINSLTELFRSVTAMKTGLKNWWFAALLSLIVLVLGFVILLNPGFVGQAFGIYVGLTLLVNGIANLISFAQYRKNEQNK